MTALADHLAPRPSALDLPAADRCRDLRPLAILRDARAHLAKVGLAHGETFADELEPELHPCDITGAVSAATYLGLVGTEAYRDVWDAQEAMTCGTWAELPEPARAALEWVMAIAHTHMDHPITYEGLDEPDVISTLGAWTDECATDTGTPCTESALDLMDRTIRAMEARGE